MSSRPPTLWIDVDDLVRYLGMHARPSGIQRVVFELSRALHELDGAGGQVRFVRRGRGPRDLITVEWDDLRAAFRRVADTAEPVVPARSAPEAADTAERGGGLGAAVTAQAQAFGALAKVPLAAGGAVAHAVRRRLAATAATLTDIRLDVRDGQRLEDVAAPGDSLIVLGSPWSHRDYVQTVRRVRDELRMRFALLIYDLVPLRRPEWCDRGVVTTFADWYRSVLPLADQVFAISRATADDVLAWSRESGIILARGVTPVPMGTGLGLGEASLNEAADAGRVPPPGSYVLFVSTLEIRKNHALLFRVWRRLLAELPAAQVPTLVFAGRIGWLVADLLQQLDNARWLDGKIRLVRDPTDAELAALYRGCQFTVFPSFFEGWGLPVSESLALGRPCIASDRTALPEAGGTLARYFDPDRLDDACRAVREVIERPDELAAWRARVAREFRPVPWRRGAEVIRDKVRALDAVG